MALSLSLGEPRRLRFGPLFLRLFRGLTSNPAKTQTRDPNDIDGNIARTRGRRAMKKVDGSARTQGGAEPSLKLLNLNV